MPFLNLKKSINIRKKSEVAYKTAALAGFS